jgi:hypothetical protein
MEEILKYKKINSDILPELREFSNSLREKGIVKKEENYFQSKKNHDQHSVIFLLNKVCEKNLHETVKELKKHTDEAIFLEVKKRLNKVNAEILAKTCILIYEKTILLNHTQILFENHFNEGVIIFIKLLFEKKILPLKIFIFCCAETLKKDIDLFIILISNFFVKKNKSPEQLFLEKKISKLENISLRHKFLLENLI